MIVHKSMHIPSHNDILIAIVIKITEIRICVQTNIPYGYGRTFRKKRGSRGTPVNIDLHSPIFTETHNHIKIVIIINICKVGDGILTWIQTKEKVINFLKNRHIDRSNVFIKIQTGIATCNKIEITIIIKICADTHFRIE